MANAIGNSQPSGKEIGSKGYPKETMPLSSIIFDMDGAVIDSEPDVLRLRVLKSWLVRHSATEFG